DCACKPCRCPQDGACCDGCPCGQPAERKRNEPLSNFGVELDKLSATERYTVNGSAVPAQNARRLIAAGGAVPDDAGLPRLTIVGGDDQRKKARDDLEQAHALAAYRGRLVVQDYPPDHWAGARAGFGS